MTIADESRGLYQRNDRETESGDYHAFPVEA